MPIPDFFNLNRTTPPLLIVHEGDKVASDSGHGTLKEIEYCPLGNRDRIDDAIIELDIDRTEQIATCISKSLYPKQKIVGEKLVELRKFLLPKQVKGPEGYGGVNLGSASFAIAYLIEDKKEEFPQLDYNGNLELLCETLPYIIGYRTDIVAGGRRPINKELNQKYLELKKGLGLSEEEGEQLLRFDAGTEGTIGKEHPRIGGCVVCRAASDCH